MAVSVREAVSGTGELSRSEIDETLRVARIELENEIARYRVRFLLIVAVLTGIAVTIGTVLGGDAPLFAPGYFAAAALIAYGLRVAIERRGATQTFVYLSIVFDLVSSSAIFPLNELAEEDAGLEGIMFTPWLVIAPISVLVLLHSLRGDRRALLFATTLAAILVGILILVTPSPVFDPATNTAIGVPGIVAQGPAELIPLLVLGTGVVVLAGTLGIYSQEQARRRLKIHAKVLRYVPDAAYEQVRAETTDAGIRAPGRLLEVTLLSSDLRGFTAMSEKLRPQEIVDQLNAYHDAMCREIERHGGMLDKLMGDGALAVFGWKGEPRDAGAADAVACARAMRAKLAELNQARAAKSLPPLAMGIGIHTGSCVGGNVGAGKKLSYTYIGDAVNVASRVEGLTKELGAPLIATEATVSRLESRAGLRSLGTVTVRGKSEPMVVHAVE